MSTITLNLNIQIQTKLRLNLFAENTDRGTSVLTTIFLVMGAHLADLSASQLFLGSCLCLKLGVFMVSDILMSQD